MTATSPPATRSTWSTPTASPVARGLVNYDSDELPALLGRSTRELARELGASYEREVVHRDDLVLLPRTRPETRPTSSRNPTTRGPANRVRLASRPPELTVQDAHRAAPIGGDGIFGTWRGVDVVERAVPAVARDGDRRGRRASSR